MLTISGFLRIATMTTLMSMLAACNATGTATTGSTSATTEETIHYTVGPCFGACPVYAVSLMPDGKVQFEGQQHTAVQGKRVLSTSAAIYRKVSLLLKPYRPASRTTETTECENRITDQQSYHIVWHNTDNTQTVLDHNRGCLSDKNRALNQVMDRLPEELGIADWIKH